MIVSVQKTLRKGVYRAAQEFLYGRQQYLREKLKAKGFHRLLLSAPAQQHRRAQLLSLPEITWQRMRDG